MSLDNSDSVMTDSDTVYTMCSGWLAKASPYVPLFYVFMSGFGFSLQGLIVKLLEDDGFDASFECVFSRGFMQLLVCTPFIYFDPERRTGTAPKLFGDSNWVRMIMILRSFVGYFGIAFAFLAIERLPVGDASVLTMLSPFCASILGYVLLGEPWRLPEFIGTIISIVGAVLVCKPSFLFGGETLDGAGVVYGLLSSLAAGLAYVLVRMLGTVAKMPWSNVCFVQAIGQMVLSVPSSFIAGQSITLNLSGRQWALVALAGAIGSWSQALMTIGMQREKSATATAMRMSDVFFSFVWQVLFTGDAASVLSILGGVLVNFSILIIVVFKQKPVNTDNSGSHRVTQLSIDSSQHNLLHAAAAASASNHGGGGMADEDTISTHESQQERGVVSIEMHPSSSQQQGRMFSYAEVAVSVDI